MEDKKDNHHKDAIKIENYLKDVNIITVINSTVLIETLNRTIGTPADVFEMYNDLYNNNKVVILASKDYFKSLDVNRHYGNSINYSDCTIINTMLDMGIRAIVSFDSGFKKVKGFNVISSMYVFLGVFRKIGFFEKYFPLNSKGSPFCAFGNMNFELFGSLFMCISNEIKDEGLKKLVENKAKELNMSVERLIWNYINRELMEDNICEELFVKFHSEEFLKEVNEAWGLDGCEIGVDK